MRPCCVRQLLQFIVMANELGMMHKDIKMRNLYVRNAGNDQDAELMVGGFTAAQRAEFDVSLMDYL